MSLNLMDLLKDQLGNAVIGQVGKHLGMDDKSASAGMGAILPTILGGLMKQASTPSGAEALNRSLASDFGDDSGGGLLDNLSGVLGGDGDSSVMSTMGETVLKSLFGDKISSIIGVLSKVTGIGGDKSGSLLTMLAPLVMSVLGKQKQSMGLDAGGLSRLLMDQKDSVASAMPEGMGDVFGFADIGGGTPPAAAPQPASQVSHDAGNGGLMKLLLPLIVVAGLAFAAYKFLGGDAPAVPDVKVPAGVTDNLPETPDLGLSVPDVGDLTGKLGGVFDGYSETLSGITDEASATEALPKLESLNGDLDGVSGMLSKLPEGVRSTVTGKLATMIDPIHGIIEKLYAIPGVQAILEPIVGSMLEKVKGLTGS